MIKVGDALPHTTLMEYSEVEGEGCSIGPNAVDVAKATAGKTIALFALPGAFTPTCSAKHVPGYVEHYEQFKAAGVDEIWCVSVNDAFVMNEWARALNIKHVQVIPDGAYNFTRGMGMLVDMSHIGFGWRSRRYAAVINNGLVEHMFVEPESSAADPDPYGVSSPENVMKHL